MKLSGFVRTLFLFVVLLPLRGSHAQTHIIDSLRKLTFTSSQPQLKLQGLLSLCDQYQSLPKDTLWEYAIELLNLAREQKNKVAYSLGIAAQANAYLRWGNVDSALKLINSELPKNPVTEPTKRQAYFKLAALKVDCYGDASNYKDALAVLYRIISEAEQYKDSLAVALNMNTVGVIHYNLDQLNEAFAWHFKALSFTSPTPRFYSIIGALCVNIAESHRWLEHNDSATHYIDRAIDYCTRSENLYYLANALRVKSSILKNEKRFDEAEQTMLTVIRLRERTDGNLVRSNEQLSLASIYMQGGKPDKAIQILTAGLAADEREISGFKHGGAADNTADVLKISYYNTLALSYRKKGDHANYEATLEKMIAAKDSFYQLNSARALAEMQTKYNVQKNEATIATQKLDLIQKNNLFYGSLMLLVFATIIAAIIFTNYRKRQRYKLERMLREEKLAGQIAIAAAEEKERVRIAADLHDNLGAYAASIASNIDHLENEQNPDQHALAELRNNSQAIVSQLSDTIWVLKKDALYLTAISDRLKTFIQRLQASYPHILIDVDEHLDVDYLLTSFHAFHLFKILQEAITNALKHSHADRILISFSASNELWIVRVTDNGLGMGESKAGGNGLQSMNTRATEAGWNISWSPGEISGTIVAISSTTN